MKGFLPTRGRDQYTSKIKPKSLGVINMDMQSGPGTHFVCFFNSPNDETVNYYDSYGVVPPAETVSFLKSSGKPIAYNPTQHQEIGATTCGYFCIYVLKELNKGRKFHDVLLDFSYDPEENERMIHKKFNL